MSNERATAKIAIFMPAFGGGGSERVVINLADGFHRRGHSVDIVVTRYAGALRDQVPDGVRVIDLGASRIIKGLPGLVRYLKGNNPDVMLSALPVTNCMAVWARRLAKVQTKMVLSEHNTFSEANKHSRNLREKVLPSLMRHSYGKADEIIAVSKGVADDLAEVTDVDRSRIVVIHNPIVTAELVELAEQPVEHTWFSEEDVPVVLGVGRLIPQKDFRTLINAFALVRRRTAARLVILGEGPDRHMLEAHAKELGVAEDVALLGFKENPYAYMRGAGVFVLSSQWEGFGNVLVEALAVGTTVVSTDCPSGPDEILESGRWGRLVPTGDPSEMAGAIIHALGEEYEPARRIRADDFSVTKAVVRYERVLLRALSL